MSDQPAAEDIQAAYEAGRRARSRNLGWHANPYTDWWLGTAWAQGWHDRWLSV